MVWVVIRYARKYFVYLQGMPVVLFCLNIFARNTVKIKSGPPLIFLTTCINGAGTCFLVYYSGMSGIKFNCVFAVQPPRQFVIYHLVVNQCPVISGPGSPCYCAPVRSYPLILSIAANKCTIISSFFLLICVFFRLKYYIPCHFKTMCIIRL